MNVRVSALTVWTLGLVFSLAAWVGLGWVGMWALRRLDAIFVALAW